MTKIVEFFIKKNVISYPDVSYLDYWRLAHLKDEDAFMKNKYDKYICAWIPILWSRGGSETLLSISRFIEKVNRLQKGEQEGFVEYSDEMNVAFEGAGVQFSCVIDSWEETPEGQFSLAEVIFLLEAWHGFLQMPDSELSRMELVLPCFS